MLRILLIALLASPAALAQTTYVWTDENGRKHYSDQPPPKTVDASQKRFDARAPDAVPPYAVRQVAQKFPVVVYTGQGCTTFCDQARKLLKARGVPYSEKAVATPEEIAALAERFEGNNILPSIEVGHLKYAGFTEGRWNAMLDEVGYPSSLAGLR